MKNRKLTGSFYTPKIIADFLVNYLSEKTQKLNAISILEPSAGDGIFVKSIYSHNSLSKKLEKVIAIEINKEELDKISNSINDISFTAIHSDFLDFQSRNNEKFSIVLGNPPYIKKNLLKIDQIDHCKGIHQKADLSDTTPKNIWTAFLVRCIEFTNERGILAFVLPSELLQVKFASELRELILKEFERVEIFTFNELLFKDCKGQDTLLLIGERKSDDKGVYYCNIDKVSDLSERRFTLAQNIKVKESKWTHHHLDTDEIILLERVKEKLKTINNYCDSRAGIVTAANDFFIVNSSIVEKYSMQDFVKPIIQKGVFVNGSVELTADDFHMLSEKLKPTYLIVLDKNSIIRKNAKLWSYLQIGRDKMIHTRYKTSIRSTWYEIPNIGSPAQAFFFKRCNEYPKLVKNSANVLATDSAYAVTMKDDYEVENLIFSFYNSLTLSFAELYGRYYGGGVLELTPSEFKNLPIPYTPIIPYKFDSFAIDFRNKTSITDICEKNDRYFLKKLDIDLDDDSIKKISSIREKLFHRRLKTN